MAGVSMGQCDMRLPVESGNEIGAFTRSFNDVSARLDDANVMLKRYEASTQHILLRASAAGQPQFSVQHAGYMIGMATQNDTQGIIQSCACPAAMSRYAPSTHVAVPLSDELRHVRTTSSSFGYVASAAPNRRPASTRMRRSAHPQAVGSNLRREWRQTRFHRRPDNCRVLIRALDDAPCRWA